ncbi:MAG: hypothetical protein RLZZ373_1736 [Pseudomonadota bacterium]|jgi:hypothetical protein
MTNLGQRCKDIEALFLEKQEHAKTLALLRALKAGEVSLDDIELVDGGWRERIRPETPEPLLERQSLNGAGV